MKIVFLSQYFLPELGATSELLSGIALSLAKKPKMLISGLAGQPNYFGASKVDWKIKQDNVTVYRVRSTQLDKNSIFGRVLNSLTFAISVFFRLIKSHRNDLVVVVTNPPLLPIVCYAVSKICGIKYIVILHDIYPDIAVELNVLGNRNFLVWFWRKLNRLAYAKAERVVVLGRDMQQLVKREIDSGSTEKIEIIENWADKNIIVPVPRLNHPIIDSLSAQSRFVVVYSGNIGRFHEIETVLKAARILDDGSFLFLFYGTGKQVSLVQKAEINSKNNSVKLFPFQPRKRIGQTLTGCDVNLVTLRKGLSGLAVPSKLYGAMAAGRPIVVVAPSDCEASLVVQENNCGMVVAPDDSEELARCLISLRDNPVFCKSSGDNARRAFEENYELEKIANKWHEMLKFYQE